MVRHAAHDNVGGFLAGRTPGIRLGEAGRAQAARLGQRMASEQFDAIYASPRERTQETAAAIAAERDLPVHTAPELDEVDFGAWSGKTFDVLNTDPTWRQWNTIRSLSRTAGGESMLDVQRRALTLLERLVAEHENGRLVLVSHADIIKTLVSYVLGLPIDAWPRFDIGPASITTIVVGDWGAKLWTLNEVIS
nr:MULTISPECIES: histidine phosphatase family protein [unclassified Devosia]